VTFQAGRVVEKSGTFAQSQLLTAVTGNTFNAANEMTAFNGTTMTYDGNHTGERVDPDRI
jgi:hypothetical protein